MQLPLRIITQILAKRNNTIYWWKDNMEPTYQNANISLKSEAVSAAKTQSAHMLCYSTQNLPSNNTPIYVHQSWHKNMEETLTTTLQITTSTTLTQATT